MQNLLPLFLCAVFSALASFFLKIGAQSLTGSITIQGMLSNAMIWLGGIFYVTAFMAYVFVLRGTPLTLAQPIITAGASLLTVILATLFLKESMNLINMLGLMSVILGVFLLFSGRG